MHNETILVRISEEKEAVADAAGSQAIAGFMDAFVEFSGTSAITNINIDTASNEQHP